MAESRFEKKKEKENLGWIYVRSNSDWKRRYAVILDGNLQIFSSDKQDRVKKVVNIGGSRVCIVGPSLSPNSLGESAVSTPWEKLLRQPFPDEGYSCETSLVVIEPHKGKPCCLLALNQKEANSWKETIEEAESALLKAPERQTNKSSNRQGPNAIMSRATSAMRRSFRSNKKVEACREEATGNLKGNSEISAVIEKINFSEVVNTDIRRLDPLWPELDTLQGCTDFLRSNCLHAHALENAKLMVDYFKGCYQMGDSSLSDEFRLEAWKGTMRRIIKALVDQLIMSNPTLEPCLINEENMNQIWLACETWIFGAVHDKIMGACKQMFALKDKMLDVTLARLEKVDPLALGVRGEFENFVLGDALYQFKQINRFKTPLEKATCLRKTINSILQGIQSVVKSSTRALQDIEGLLPCTDDLISFMVLLMARAKVQNLQANASYMENFLYVNKEDGDKGELGFHITNFIAACSYLQSKEIKDIVSRAAPKTGRVSCPSGLPASAVHDVNININVGEDTSNHRGRVCGIRDAEQWNESLLLSRKVGMTFPGESPDFLLASTYQ